MYNCIIDVVAVGCDSSVIEIFEAAELPEDSEIRINNPAPNNPDTVYIFGSIQAYCAEKDRKGYSAVICDGREIPEGCPDLWIIPENSSCKNELIKHYFLKLIEKVKDRFDYRIMKICFETAADSVPDLMWYKNLRGAHLMVNDAFCAVTEKTKAQIYKKGHYYIWDIPQEEYEQGDYVCLESEEIVIKAGKTCLFDEKVKTKSGMRQFKTYKSPLYDINGELFGTCGIARDVTDLHRINSELTVVLESVPFGIIMEDNDETLVGTNKALESYFPDIRSYEGKNCSEWKTRVMGEAEEAGVTEFAVRKNGLPRILKFSKEPIADIFGEIVGRVTIFQDMTAERIFQKKTLEHANTDFLTGLNNRRSLFVHLDKIKKSNQIAMITIDLDNFKKVNDTCGHKRGDDVLVKTANLLTECFSEDFISRLGGDEFLVVVNREVSHTKLIEETQKFIDTFNKTFGEHPELAVMTVSAGLSVGTRPENGEINAESLMYSSDSALYESKKGGKSRLSFYKD